MPRIDPVNRSVTTLQGLHLYHSGWSNCSMRVRMTLAEKGLTWTSHHLDTRSGEHVTREYFGINPNGVVPTLVHDGVVWIESNDIIRYLDERFPEPRLAPAAQHDRERWARWTRLADEVHVPGVKTFMYCSFPLEKRRKSPADLDTYRQLQHNRQLLAFHTRNSSTASFTSQECRAAEDLLHRAFAQLDQHLGSCRWLAGDAFSLADITWIPLHFTLARAGFSFAQHDNLVKWSEAVAARASFNEAVVAWYAGPPASLAQP
jgi:glutathione S-transferase